MKDSGKKQPLRSGTPPPSPKKSRLFLKLFLGFAGLLAVLTVVLLSVDLNTFREPVAKAISQATGMKVKIEYLGWSFSEGLKIDCKGVQVFSGENENEELVSTKELLISLNWLPLLEKKVVVNSISLVEPVLTVTINSPATKNPSPLLEKSSGAGGNPDVASPASNDPAASDPIQTAREFLKNPDFTLTEVNLIAGRVILKNKATGKEIALDTEARMKIERDDQRIGLALEDIKLGTGQLRMEGEVRTDDFLSATLPMQSRFSLSPFKTSDLLPVLGWVSKDREAQVRKLKLKGDINTLDLKLDTPIDTVMDLDSLMKSVDAALVLKGQEISLVQYGNTISISSLDTDIQWKEQQVDHKIIIGTLDGTAETQGRVVLAKGTNELDSKLSLTNINLQTLKTQFFSNTESFPKEGTLSASFHVQGPALQPQRLRGNGTIDMQNIVLPVQGTVISVASMKGQGKWQDGNLNHQFQLTALGGETIMKGDLKLEKDKQGNWSPVINADVIPKSIKLAELKPIVQKEWFPGQGTLTGNVHIKGPVLLPDTLKGKGSIKVSNIAVKVNNTAVAVPEVMFDGTWANNKLIHDLKVKVLDGNIQTKGQLLVKKDRRGNQDPILNSKIFIKNVSLKQIKPLVANDLFPHQGVVNGTFQVQGPVTRFQKMNGSGKLEVKNVSTLYNGKNITLSHVSGQGAWKRDNLKHHINAKLLGGEVSLKGNLNFKKNKQGELDPMISSEVSPKSIQLAKLRELIEKDWLPETGVVNGSIHLKGPVKNFSQVALTGKLSGDKIRVNLQGKPLAIKKTLLLFKPNAKKHNQMGFNLNEISFGEFKLKKTIGRVMYSPSTVELTQGKVWPETGQVSLNGNYKFKTKDYKLNFEGAGLRLEDYKGEYLEGPLGFKGNLFGKVLSKGFKKGLSGNVQVRSENSKLRKAGDALGQIINALNIKGLKGLSKGLPIDFLGGDGTIKNGVFFTKNFRMLSPPLKLWLNGKADLTEENIKAEAMAIPKQSTEKVFKKVDKEKERIKKQVRGVPILGEILGGSKEKGGVVDELFKSVPIFGNSDKKDGQPRALIKVYFAINGTFDKPTVKLAPEKSLGFK